MDQAKDDIRRRLGQAKAFLAQESPPKLSESDTKANFIEPIISALGWEGIGVVTREYYVRNSQEFIDYVMASSSGPLLAIEAKPLQTDLTDKHAAQLIQYCAVEGIEWAALTNGRELQFFNSFLKPDLAAKRVLRLDLLAFNSDAEFDALFSQVWQLSRESMTTPSGVRTWLNQKRLDATLRGVLLDSSSPIVRQLRKLLADAEIDATSQDISQWFRGHLRPQVMALSQLRPTDSHKEMQPAANSGRPSGSPMLSSAQNDLKPGPTDPEGRALTSDLNSPLFESLRRNIESRLPGITWRPTSRYVAAELNGQTFLAVRVRQRFLLIGLTLPSTTSSPRVDEIKGEFRWRRMTRVARVTTESSIDHELLALIEAACLHSASILRSREYSGASLRDLVDEGLVLAGAPLVLIGKAGREVAHAHLNDSGEIVWNGRAYQSPSDKAFASVLGRQSLNGWTTWCVALPEGQTPLSTIRERFKESAQEHEKSRAVM